ncbi:MAG: efflux RND transporter periplasmic adaptor subunit [Bacteroidota bacterium]|nr:efflux RND transporter periplasmic adaptor subunit [Bacteroidota bacterium]MDW8137508.1 efflux RND transporter periplasmic adaptor subunit [Bacteroidota bacterium]
MHTLRLLSYGIGALVLIGCQRPEAGGSARSPQETTIQLQPAAASERILNVEVTPLQEKPFDAFLRLTGTAAAYYDLRLAAEEGGRVAKVYADKGAYVSAGGAIVKLDDTLLRTALEEAEASHELAKETYERQRRLWQEDSIGTELQYLQARYAYAAARSKLETLRARLEKTVVRAPVSGIVDRLFVHEGEMAAPGAPVARLVHVDRIKVTAGVPERWAERIRPGMPAQLSFDVLPGRTFRGRIAYVGPSIDAQNRTLPIEVEIPNPGRLIKPEMVAELRILLTRLPAALVVPKAVLVRTEAGFQVFVAARQADGSYRAEARRVELGPENETEVVVTKGLAPGELLITVGYEKLNPNDRVRILNPVQPVAIK